MPHKLELASLEAELAGLTLLLDEAETIADPIGTMQYQQRKDELGKLIDQLRASKHTTANVALFFSGAPVLGSRGIAADFAGRALNKFQDIISKVYARAELGMLAERGRVPLRHNNTLMITGLTHGSFGFVLDELTDQTEIQETALSQIVGDVCHIIECSGSINEIDFEAIANEIDSRTLISLREFFKDIDANEATIRLVDNERDIAMDRYAISRARYRTEATQIDENDDELEGILKGLLPDHRRFELVIENGKTIYGSVTAEAVEQYVRTLSSGNPAIGKKCRIKIHIRTVRALNRTPTDAYRLTEFLELGL